MEELESIVKELNAFKKTVEEVETDDTIINAAEQADEKGGESEKSLNKESAQQD